MNMNRKLAKLLLAAAAAYGGGAALALATNTNTSTSVSVSVTVAVPANLTTRALVRDAYGYSVEPVWLSSFANTSLMATLLQEMADVAGKAPPVRIGGTTSDETTLYESLAGGGVSNGTGQLSVWLPLNFCPSPCLLLSFLFLYPLFLFFPLCFVCSFSDMLCVR